MAGGEDYLRAVASAAGQGLLTAIWVAAGELSSSKRRAARLSVAAATAGFGWATGDKGGVRSTSEVRPTVRAESDERDRRLGPVAISVIAALSVGPLLARRQLEKRWLVRLRRHGHNHPHRALAVRMGLLAIACCLPGQLLSAHEAAKKRARCR